MSDISEIESHSLARSVINQCSPSQDSISTSGMIKRIRSYHYKPKSDVTKKRKT